VLVDAIDENGDKRLTRGELKAYMKRHRAAYYSDLTLSVAERYRENIRTNVIGTLRVNT
jgi:hypothetical protein